MKRPSFQFYPGDWLRDTGLRACSIGARGLWIDMICLMHEGSVYGYLKVGNKVILPSNLARMVGATLQEVEGWLVELNDADVFSKDDNGCIFSRRMIRDEQIRESRAAGGIKGGNPALTGGQERLDERLTSKDNQNPTPSSASASSPSKSKTKSKDLSAHAAQTKGTRLPENWVLPKAWGEWALNERPELTADEVRKMAETFKDHWLANANRATGKKADWLATWRNWVRNQKTKPAQSQSVQQARLTVAQQIMGGTNGTHRPTKDITPGRTIEGDGKSIPETTLRLREPDAG